LPHDTPLRISCATHARRDTRPEGECTTSGAVTGVEVPLDELNTSTGIAEIVATSTRWHAQCAIDRVADRTVTSTPADDPNHDADGAHSPPGSNVERSPTTGVIPSGG
jgi:hypothetical protein